MMDTLGAVAGPLVAVLLLGALAYLPRETIYRRIFLLSAIPGLLSLVIIALLVKDRGREVKRKITGVSALRSRPLQLFLVVVAIGTLGRYSYAFTLWKVRDMLHGSFRTRPSTRSSTSSTLSPFTWWFLLRGD